MGQKDDVINIAKSYLGTAEHSAKHKEILSIYNGYRPLARNYKMTEYDAWCMAFISAVFIKADAVNALGRTECACEEYLQYAKSMSMTVLRQSATSGDIVLYDWGGDGRSDHVGIVTERTLNTLRVLEGNKSDSVAYRLIDYDNSQIRAIVRPLYKNVLTGGSEPVYDRTKVSYAATFEKKIAGKYKCTARDYLNLRYNPFEKSGNIITQINGGDYVHNYGYRTGDWYLVEYKGYTGFAHCNWLGKTR